MWLWRQIKGRRRQIQTFDPNNIKTDFPGKSSTFFESPINHKRFIFEHSYISYGKRQKSCTLIVILVILSYQTSPIFNSSSKSTGFLFCKRGSTFYQIKKDKIHTIVFVIMIAMIIHFESLKCIFILMTSYKITVFSHLNIPLTPPPWRFDSTECCLWKGL